MDTKQLSYDTPKTGASIVGKYSVQERTHLTLSSSDCLEYALLWNAKVGLLVQTGLKCSESLETILLKIYDFSSNEIKTLEKEVKQNILRGA